MDGNELRRRRTERGLTQDQVANAIETAFIRRADGHRWEQGERTECITQSFVSQMENEQRPIPTARREFDGRELPSINKALEELLSLSDAALHDRVVEGSRGPYRNRPD